MIHINFDAAKLNDDANPQWWADWEARAQDATKEVLDAWEAMRKDPNDTTYKKIFDKPSIQKVWSDLKNRLLPNLFHNKCAYCETPMIRATLHAEHYRPKGRVTQNGKKVKVKDEEGQELAHPGYFWLAFHWTNLLPACEWCNTVNGKRNEFPIPKTTYLSVLKKLTTEECDDLKEQLIQSSNWPDIFYFQPVDLDDKEGRLLLHPYFDDPSKSLQFDDFGEVVARGTDDDKLRGDWSIKVYNLNDGKIVPVRRSAQDEALNTFDTITKYHRIQGLSLHEAKVKAKADESIVGFLEGKKPYSAAVVDFLRLAHPNYF
jgi:hypothetical protein